jgi:hypothetical protein
LFHDVGNSSLVSLSSEQDAELKFLLFTGPSLKEKQYLILSMVREQGFRPNLNTICISILSVRDVISPHTGSPDQDRISGSARSETRPDRGRLPFVAVGPPLAQRHIKEGPSRGTGTNVHRARSAATNPNLRIDHVSAGPPDPEQGGAILQAIWSSWGCQSALDMMSVAGIEVMPLVFC